MDSPLQPHRRRPRYRGTHPRHFAEKYKELEQRPETLAKVLASGKTPAGSHVPILVAEILEVLDPKPRDLVVDCTLGHGGHTRALLQKILPGGRLIGLDADPLELPRTEAALRAEGFGEEVFTARKSNFAGIQAALAGAEADAILADLGVSSMQLDNPQRGFTSKHEGPLDMRMNPSRGISAATWLERVRPDALAEILHENSDEPHAALLAPHLAGKTFPTTRDLANAIRTALIHRPPEEIKKTVTRVFQAIRIEVNEEFAALDALLRVLPFCLKPGGRVAILTFHSGEDRRVKKAFQAGLREGLYSDIAREVIRAGPDERHANPRSIPAKLRWARR
ncbi:MAG: 16S rRNA (cytosine(1402)-N(4))-methyltransferase RsmH [Verrucomicrobiota bacterium]